MTGRARDLALQQIRSNIDENGSHIYVVSGGPLPRFAYTIGVRSLLGAELILAGAAFYSAEDVARILNQAVAMVRLQPERRELGVEIDSFGSFSLRNADASWTTALMLGALDFYGEKQIAALQLVPDHEHWTVDVPNLAQRWNATAEPVWQWLYEPWRLSVSARSVATTNLDALRGERITEAARWEEDQWELFAGSGPDLARDQIRVVPLATLLAVDESLTAVTGLQVGRALWREPLEAEWRSWG